MNNLQQLLDRVKAATGPDRELDGLIIDMITGTSDHYAPAYTASIDAALALTERVLPGWTVDHLGQNSLHAGDPWSCKLAIYFGSDPSKNRSAFVYSEYSTSPLAILAAMLSALIAKEVGE